MSAVLLGSRHSTTHRSRAATARNTPFALAAFYTPLATLAAFANSITPIADAQRGAMGAVHGCIERITDEDGSYFGDASSTIRIHVGPSWFPAENGKTVIANGFVDDDLVPRDVSTQSDPR